MSCILSVGHQPERDSAIVKKQFHTYAPYTSSFGNNDEVRIAIQSQDLYVLPSESYISLEVIVSRKVGNAHANVAGVWAVNHASALFSEIRYELNNIEIDRVKNPRITGLMKRIAAHPEKDGRIARQTGYYNGAALEARTYSLFIPLNHLFGFCDDYRKIILNAKHELVLVRSRSDITSFSAATDSFNIRVSKIQWKIPHIQLSDDSKLMMLKYLERKRSITVPYRSWDLYEMPQLPQSDKHIWTVKSTSQMSKPRFVFVAFQTNRQIVSANASEFDPCNISNVKLFLNAESYPYENYNLDFPGHNCQEAHLDMLRIQHSYYSGQEGENPFQYLYNEYYGSPVFAFDCSRSEESLLGGAVDIRLEINARENIQPHTVAYCLIIYENQFEYSPFSSIVVKKT